MGKVREVTVDVLDTGNENEAGFIIRADDNLPLSPQEILDAIADTLLHTHGKIEYYSTQTMDS